MANGCWMAWCLAWNAVQRFIFCWLFFVFFSNELALLFHLVLYIVVLMAWLKPIWWKRTAFHWRSEPMWRWPCTLQLINLADIEPDGTQKFTFFWGLKQSCYAIVWIYIYRIVASTNKKASPEKSCVICVQLPPESLAREDSCIYIQFCGWLSHFARSIVATCTINITILNSNQCWILLAFYECTKTHQPNGVGLFEIIVSQNQPGSHFFLLQIAFSLGG